MAETTEHHCSNGKQNRHFTLVAFVNENAGNIIKKYMVQLFPWYGVKDGVLDFATCGRSETGFAKTINIMYQDLSIPAGLADQSQCSVNTSTTWVDTQIPACACLVTSTLHQHIHHHHRYQIIENFEEMLNFYGGRTSFPFFSIIHCPCEISE